MPDGNPIVDAAASEAASKVSALEGSGLAQDANDLVTQVARGDWTEGLVSLASAGLETAELLKDPLAKLVSMGLGWVIEYFEPLRWLLDQLVGDQEQIDRLSLTWEGISTELGLVAEELDRDYKADTAAWSGPGVGQYTKFCGEMVELYSAAAGASAATASLIKMSGVVLKIIRTIIRQLFTDCVGKVISILCRYPPPATPAAAPEVATAIVNTGSMMSKWLQKLQRVFANASQLLKDTKQIFKISKRVLKDLGERAAKFTSPARQAQFMAAARRSVLIDEPVNAARNAAMDAVADGVKSLPQKVVVEGMKGSGKAVAEDIDGESELKPTGEDALYEGPGPYRISGTLESQ